MPEAIRAEVEAELEARGAAALHAELAPALASTVHPNDRKRIARLTELVRAGIEPHTSSEGLWTARLHRPALLVGLTTDADDLRARIDARVDEMVRLGAEEEVRAALAAGASRTARMAIGFEELLAGDVEAMKARPVAVRQAPAHLDEEDARASRRSIAAGRATSEVAARIVAMLD